MSGKVKPPLFTLRGHNNGVTALAHCVISGVPYLISGDEAGSVVVWNLLIYRISHRYQHLSISSRIQSLRVIKLFIKSERLDVLVIQSRDHGIQLIDLNPSLEKSCEPIIYGSFETVKSLFSRGDAINIDDSRAILAYPSCLENYLVTIRIISRDAETQLSGTAKRDTAETKTNSIIFDIVIKENPTHGHLLFVSYEDGYLCIFSFNSELTTTVPILNTVGLKVDLVKSINLNIGDFITGFDVLLGQDSKITALCGSPLDKLIIVSDLMDPNATFSDVKLKRQGSSAIAIRPDCKLFAVACWDSVVRLYSMKTLAHLANIKHHSKQVQSVLFIERPDSDLDPPDNSLLNQSKKMGKYLLCCASMEGTISISVIY